EIEAKLLALARPICEGAGIEMVHLELGRQKGGWHVRLFIDKPGGVTLDDCAAISRQFGEELDALDVVDGAYTLEVSSPGLDRPLRNESDYRRVTGRPVTVSLFEPVQGQKHIRGRLAACE